MSREDAGSACDKATVLGVTTKGKLFAYDEGNHYNEGLEIRS